MSRVVHLRRDPRTVRVDRGTPWGNPFGIGERHPETGRPMAREDVLALHEEWMLLGGGRRLLENRLRELDGIHDEPICHGQVLLRLLDRRTRTGEEERPRRRFVFSGSRGWFHRAPVRRLLEGLPEGAVVVTGGARGLDAVAESEASRLGLAVGVFEADWDAHGKKAGPIRDERVLKLPGVEALYAFRSKGRSPGTDGAVRLAKRADISGRLVRER